MKVGLVSSRGASCDSQPRIVGSAFLNTIIPKHINDCVSSKAVINFLSRQLEDLVRVTYSGKIYVAIELWTIG